MTFTAEQSTFFDERGYLGPLPLFAKEDAEKLGQRLARRVRKFPVLKMGASHRRMPVRLLWACKNRLRQRQGQPFPSGYPSYWYKSAHILLPEVTSIGKCEEFLSLTKDLLGSDILLWGSELVEKPSRRPHPWHVDIEHMAWDGVTFWLALTNVSQQSTIRFLPGSHRYDFTPESLASKPDLNDDQAVLSAIRNQDPKAQIVSLEMKPGQFVLFAGRVWHSTVNETERTRQALVFQYCRPDVRIRVPLNYDVPTSWFPNQPWVLLAAGEDRYGINHIQRR